MAVLLPPHSVDLAVAIGQYDIKVKIRIGSEIITLPVVGIELDHWKREIIAKADL